MALCRPGPPTPAHTHLPPDAVQHQQPLVGALLPLPLALPCQCVQQGGVQRAGACAEARVVQLAEQVPARKEVGVVRGAQEVGKLQPGAVVTVLSGARNCRRGSNTIIRGWQLATVRRHVCTHAISAAGARSPRVPAPRASVPAPRNPALKLRTPPHPPVQL